jgi:hypothetical protein
LPTTPQAQESFCKDPDCSQSAGLTLFVIADKGQGKDAWLRVCIDEREVVFS